MAQGDLILNVFFLSPPQEAVYCSHFLSVYFVCVSLEHCHFFKFCIIGSQNDVRNMGHGNTPPFLAVEAVTGKRHPPDFAVAVPHS